MRPSPLLLVALIGMPMARPEGPVVQGMIAYGAGNSAGGQYTLTGSVAPTAPQSAQGGNYAVHEPLWFTGTVLQTDGVPTLKIQHNGVSLTIAWPSPSSGFQLQESATLNLPAWTDVNAVPSTSGDELQFVQPLPAGTRYYRLRKP